MSFNKKIYIRPRVTVRPRSTDIFLLENSSCSAQSASQVSSNEQPPSAFKKNVFLKAGFTLIETLVGVAVFVTIATAAYGAYVGLFHLINVNQTKLLAINLANEQFEIARNMPYSEVGVVNSIPNGVIPYTQSLARGGITFTVTTIVRDIDILLGSATTSTSTSGFNLGENKLVQVTVSCPTCVNFFPVTLDTQVAPRGLVASSTNGALFTQVFDANGVAVQDANVTVTNTKVTPNVVVNDVTDATGVLRLIDVATGTNAYQVTVTKPGYSTDRTYAPGSPSPVKPNITVAAQQVSTGSFSIDRLSTISFFAVSPTCTPTGGLSATMTGAKTIASGTPKFAQSITMNGVGVYSTTTVEWDTYTFKLNGTTYDLAGLNPLNPVTVNPGSTQSVMFVVMPHNPDALLVSVKDNATGLPITGASVTLTKTGYSSAQFTGQGYTGQTDWSGGSGQAAIGNANQYFADDGNVNVTGTPGDVKLRSAFGTYNPTGVLESSTFDTGTTSNFYSLTWLPASQSPLAGSTSVQFQFATSPSSTPATWNYTGPDGTAGTFYNVSGTSLNSVLSNNEYARYKLFLSTNTATVTPDLSDVNFTFATSCTPPGQVFFNGLSAGTYSITVSASGYATYSGSVNVGSAWQEDDVSVSAGP
jgi:prepilin-type N-terminal cleavage/methylation domain-containing protein